ncbi:YdeI/OmpD-associated family protein [Aurantibacter crassamenti]|uniref:YdeI/OmpD-associated family protein n=1 Tax=Aurantibacter crassamenti TaxID=1837375 RepID=UPI00193A9265|nr:YdeI/OmpD-associated family protein [Aurantibacter crassamenti]MBM1107635.1 YdeI/OmpD-associated family protein [Aurantibacter crassamenti]
MKSEVFEITITGKYFGLQLPEKIVLPFLEKNLKRVKVIATFKQNIFAFHGAIQKRNGNYFMMFGKRYQKELGVFPNDYFQLQLFEDTSKYGVDMPEELKAVLHSDFEANEIFESFTAGKKRGIIYAVLSYKNSQTRIDKSLLICENLKRGIRKNPELLKSF